MNAARPVRSALTPVRQIAAHELVLDQMRRSMETGQFRPGDRLPPERDLAEMLMVSRTTVRAAVAVLEREGQISVRRGRGGGFVVQPPVYDLAEQRRTLRRNKVAVRDAFDYRTIVETGAARLAAERRRQADITNLRGLVTSMNEALQVSLGDQTAQRVTEFQALDSAFHLGIAEAAQNADLAAAVAEARRRMFLPVGAIFGRLEENANDLHEAILDAIEAGDSALATARMDEHIAGTRRTIETWLQR